MSDSAAPGPGAADAPQPDNPPPAQVTKDDGSSIAPAKTWLDGLSGDNRKLAESKGWKEAGDIEKVFTSYAELEKYRGQSVKLPAADASEEEWAEYQSKLPPQMRAPESPDKYEFKLPEGLPENLPYNEALAASSKAWMHEAGLSPKQAQVVHDGFVKAAAESYTAEQTAAAQATAQKVEATHDDLVKEWGPQDSEGFKKKHGLSNAAIKGLGLVDVFKESGILLEDGSLTNSQVAKALLAIGEKMFDEDTIDARGGVPEGVNPFKKDAKGNRNVTLISALVTNDPDRAKRLCKEAGEKWSDWAPDNPR